MLVRSRRSSARLRGRMMGADIAMEKILKALENRAKGSQKTANGL